MDSGVLQRMKKKLLPVPWNCVGILTYKRYSNSVMLETITFFLFLSFFVDIFMMHLTKCLLERSHFGAWKSFEIVNENKKKTFICNYFYGLKGIFLCCNPAFFGHILVKI